MAYAAVISLKHTINGLLHSSRISHVSSTPQILEFAYNLTASMQQLLERLNDSSRRSSKRLDALDGKIRNYAHKLEDVLEFHELNQSCNFEELKEEITSFGETMKLLEKDYIEELSREEEEEDEDDDDVAIVLSKNIDFGVEMVGHSRLFATTREYLLRRMRPDELLFFAFLGEEGSGRTVVAERIFADLCKGRKDFFDCCAWVTVGKHQFKDVLLSIIVQVYNPAACYYEFLILREDEKLCSYLYTILEHQRYMIVLGDVRDVRMVDNLRRWLPDQSNGSIVFLTTSLEEVAELADRKYNFELSGTYFIECVWFSLRFMIFGLDSISPELEEAGKKIFENCRGLFISAAKTFLFLYKSEKTVEQWSKIAADNENPIFMVADEISVIRKIKRDMQFYNWDIDDQRREDIVKMISIWIEFSHTVEKAKMVMHPKRFFSKMQIVSLYGMAGIGKSTFARKMFKDESVVRHFDHRVWITLGQKYQTTEILIDILAQIYPDIDRLDMKGDEKLVGDLFVQLSCKRCLIVLDDMWSKEPLYYLKNLFPDIKGTTLVTTTLTEVAKFEDDNEVEMQLLDLEESWCLLRQKVFSGGLCPPELEAAGRKIAENCEGLPLLILTVADQLLKVEISQEFWDDVASGKQKSIFMNAHNQISEGLLPSYHILSQHLKPCFLYMGVFRGKYEISASKLTNLLIAEGFLEPNSPQLVEDFIAECLSKLANRSLIMVQHKVSDFQIKTCRLHAVFWHLSNSEAMKNNFFHAMNSYDNCFIESIESQRRLCIRNSTLLGLKSVQNSMTSIKSAHSLLCVSPFQQYPVSLSFDFRLLRVMNALTIRLYEFPVEVVRLVLLRYLGLTCDGKLPTSISSLWKLEYLVVKRYMSIKSLSLENSSLLPVEIWDMKGLKHLQVMGGCLPDHKRGSGFLNLSTLLDVSAQSCREEVLKWIPNLKRLGIRIELGLDDKGDSFHYLNNISRVCGLESLKCVVVNPEMRLELVPPVSMFPSSLRKLSLSGLGYPWEHMSIIGELENLEVLKLKHYAFQGAKWEMDHTSRLFNKLKFLLVEDTNLVNWKVNSLTPTKLERLHIKHCYKLKELPTRLQIHHFANIEIVDCNPSTVSWFEEIGQPKVHLSWIAETRQE